jgi:manganese/zinc/iron transport system permease protein
MMQFDHTLCLILASTALLGINAGLLGIFLVLQRKSLFADTISHATLPGITGLFLYTQSKNSLVLMCGALISAILASLLIDYLQQTTKLKKETILGIVLSTSFGIGTIFLSKIQTMANAHQAGLTRYLLGNASTMLYQDLYTIAIITTLTILCILLCYKPYQTMLFDPEFAHTHHLCHPYLARVFLILTTLTIVIGLQSVGVILITALLITPACAALLCTHSYTRCLMLSAFFGFFATSSGTLIASYHNRIPTGPVIVVIACLITLFCLLATSTTFLKIFQKKHA